MSHNHNRSVVSVQTLVRKYVNTYNVDIYEGDVVVMDFDYLPTEACKYAANIGQGAIAGVVYRTTHAIQPADCIQLGVAKIKVDTSNGDIAVGDKLIVKGGNSPLACKYNDEEGYHTFAIALEAVAAEDIVSPATYKLINAYIQVFASASADAAGGGGGTFVNRTGDSMTGDLTMEQTGVVFQNVTDNDLEYEATLTTELTIIDANFAWFKVLLNLPDGSKAILSTTKVDR